MNGTQTHISATHPPMEETKTKTVVGGSILEAFGAFATIALAIVGLAGIWPPVVAAVATIVIGAAALMEGGTLGLRSSRTTYEGRTEFQFAQGTFDANYLGGLAAVVLGILALLGIAAPTLLAVAVITLGASLLVSGRIFIGLAGAVLGILAVVGLAAPTLILVGLLTFGAGFLLAGSEMAARTLTYHT
jgi:hypothetical protein